MPEIKPNIACVEWYIFNFRIINSSEKIAALAHHQNDVSLIPLISKLIISLKFELSKTLRASCQSFKGRWCLSENDQFVRVHIESKSDAMIFKLTYSELVDKITFPANKSL